MSRSRHTPINIIPEKTCEKIQMILDDNHYEVEAEEQINYGYQYILTTGTIINVYGTGKVVVQGKRDDKLRRIIKQQCG